MISLTLHRIKRIKLSKIHAYVHSDGSGTFYSRDLLVYFKDGTSQAIGLFGDSKKDLRNVRK